MSISDSASCSGMSESQRKAKLKGKTPSKDPLYIIFLSSKRFYVLFSPVLHVASLVGFFFFFSFLVFLSPASKFKVISLTTVFGWFFYIQCPGTDPWQTTAQPLWLFFFFLTDPEFLGKCNWKVLHTPMISLQDDNSSHAKVHLISVKKTPNGVIQTSLKGFWQVGDTTEI